MKIDAVIHTKPKLFSHTALLWQKEASDIPAKSEIWGAFHQAFCQCFSLTNLLSANQMQGFQ